MAEGQAPIPCLFDHGEEAAFLCIASAGCACFPHKVQYLCLQHMHEAEPLATFHAVPIYARREAR